MVDPVTLRRFLYRCLFLALCTFVIFLKMLPLTTEPRLVPGPDLLFCITAAWVIRRPRWAPVLLVVLVLVVADLLFMRPVGLWPALGLLAFEYLRRKGSEPTELPPIVEVGMVSASFAALVAMNALVHAVMGIPQAPALPQVLHVVMTCLAYPFVIAFTMFVLQVRRAKATDVDSRGRGVMV